MNGRYSAYLITTWVLFTSVHHLQGSEDDWSPVARKALFTNSIEELIARKDCVQFVSGTIERRKAGDFIDLSYGASLAVTLPVGIENGDNVICAGIFEYKLDAPIQGQDRSETERRNKSEELSVPLLRQEIAGLGRGTFQLANLRVLSLNGRLVDLRFMEADTDDSESPSLREGDFVPYDLPAEEEISR